MTDLPEWSALSVNDGDVIVWRTGAEFDADVADVAGQVVEWLARTNRPHSMLITLDPDDGDLSALDDEKMRAAGWVRAEPVDPAFKRLAEEGTPLVDLPEGQ